MIFFIFGDTHGNWGKLNQVLNKRKPDLFAICGDFGYWPKLDNTHYGTSLGYNNKKTKIWNQYGIKNNGIPGYWCDGNHEDHEALLELNPQNKKQPIDICSQIYYMPRGTILTVNNTNILFIGGAESIDKNLRTPGVDWFYQESITQRDIYEIPDKQIDIVISHDAPMEFDIYGPNKPLYNSPSREALSVVLNKYHPKLWYFGHHHIDVHGLTKDCYWRGLGISGISSKWWTDIVL